MLSIVVVVPLTVKFPLNVKLVNVGLSALPTPKSVVCEPPSAVLMVYTPLELLNPVLLTPATDVVLALVMRPCASTVITGTNEAEP